MARHDTAIVGTTGEHFVAFRLSQLGLVVALPRAGTQTVDLFVGNMSGNRLLTIQVKTAEWALRTRGRGKNKRPHHLEFPLGHKAAAINDPAVFFAFVDLKGRDPRSIPDVYVVPSPVIYERCVEWAASAKLVRWHPPLEEAEPYKNAWSLLTAHLENGVPTNITSADAQ